MFFETVVWCLLLLTLIFAVALGIFQKKQRPPIPAKSKEGNREGFSKETMTPTLGEGSNKQKAPDPKLPRVWYVERFKEAAWMDFFAKIRSRSKEKPKTTRKKEKKREEVKEKEKEAAEQFSNEQPPPLGYNCLHEGLQWSRFNEKGFRRMLSRWKKPRNGDFGRIRTLLTWEESEMLMDLRLMANRMLQGQKFTAHFYRQERPTSWGEDDLLPEVYQIYRRNQPQGKGKVQLKKNYAQRTRERHWFGRMMDHREWQYWMDNPTDKGKKPAVSKGRLAKWKEALNSREQMLKFKIKKEPGSEVGTLFRHVKARRRWGNSLYVYFDINSVLISSDEII